MYFMSVHTNLPIESIDKSIGIAILLTNNMGIGIANTLFISVGTVGIASAFPVLLIALVIDDISDSVVMLFSGLMMIMMIGGTVH